MSASSARGGQLDGVRVLFTNPQKPGVVAPLSCRETAAHLRALMSVGYDTKKVLRRLERAGYEVFLPGHDDEKYRRAVERQARDRSRSTTSKNLWRRPEYREV